MVKKNSEGGSEKNKHFFKLQFWMDTISAILKRQILFTTYFNRWILKNLWFLPSTYIIIAPLTK
jgi:hypothetical protein